MGIKHFFYWFRNNFKKNIKKLKKNETFEDVSIDIDNLMLDLNGIFHSSTQKVYEYGKGKLPQRLLGTNRRKKMGGIKTQIKVFEDVCMEIENLLYISKPKKRLILCVDGPAPLSKQNQQRQRRFKSASEKEEEEFNRFDSNSLTPGTMFMDYLTKYIDWYIKKSVSENPIWQNIDIIFSSEKIPGEGEHKIIKFIRKFGEKYDSYCIHGLDADLIMLAMGTHVPNFWILREDLYSHNEFFVINIEKTREELASLMNWKKTTMDDIKNKDDEKEIQEKRDEVESYKPFNKEYAVNDFIFMCFMVGNDFLPHIPSLEIIEGSIDNMIEIYKNVCKTYGHLTRKRKDEIKFSKKSLTVFLGTISRDEKSMLEDKLYKKDKFFPDLILEKNGKYKEDKWDINIENYRKDYYEHNLPNTDNKKICHEYLDGLQWVLSYYTRGVPNWEWCFKHHYAPFAYDIAQHIEKYVFQKYKESIPMLPFQQLLSVLPPKSHRLIPEPLNKLLSDENSAIKKYCPDKIEIDVSGKRQEWEGIVILPIVDFEVIKEEYGKHIDKVSEKDMRRNVVGKSYIYNYSPNTSFIFKSFYGDIQECKMTRKIIDL